MRFVSVDVETANADMASIGSIGIAVFSHGILSAKWYSLIDPQEEFDPINASIHGITAADVSGAPTFAEAASELDRWLNNEVVVTHTHFDRVALIQAAKRWTIPALSCTWLDSACVARRTWEVCAYSGYGLANVCRLIGYNFQHHNALEDAKAAGHVLDAAMQKKRSRSRWLAEARAATDQSEYLQSGCCLTCRRV